MKAPLVSIIIPVYNGSNYIREAIDSAIAQTYENVEIIVVNDGSKDNGATEKICLSYGDRIRYIYKENGGVSTALNLGIKKMKGEWFSWLSHDDKYEINKIEKQIELLHKLNDNVNVLLCEYKHIDSNGCDLNLTSQKKRFTSCGIYTAEVVLDNLLMFGAFNGCALLIKKEVFEKSGLFNEKLRYSQDALLWYKICLNGFDFAYGDDICVCNRVHNNQLTQTGRSILLKDSIEIAKEIVPLIIEKTVAKNRLLYLYARRSAILHCKDAFDYCMQQAELNGIFYLHQKVLLKGILFYGKIRPFIRRLYYRFFKGVVTQ
jgi:glycosyltransferase involved in cell wall biosynthesis